MLEKKIPVKEMAKRKRDAKPPPPSPFDCQYSVAFPEVLSRRIKSQIQNATRILTDEELRALDRLVLGKRKQRFTEPEPRFPTGYQIAGFVDYVSRTGHTAPGLAAYFSWPGFFAAVAAGFCIYAALLVRAVSSVKTPNAELATTS